LFWLIKADVPDAREVLPHCPCTDAVQEHVEEQVSAVMKTSNKIMPITPHFCAFTCLNNTRHKTLGDRFWHVLHVVSKVLIIVPYHINKPCLLSMQGGTSFMLFYKRTQQYVPENTIIQMEIHFGPE